MLEVASMTLSARPLKHSKRTSKAMPHAGPLYPHRSLQEAVCSRIATSQTSHWDRMMADVDGQC